MSQPGILVVANRTCPCPGLVEFVAERARGRNARVLVLAPALNGRLRHWLSDVDDARRQAEERLASALAAFAAAEIAAEGEVGDADPVQAIEDALRQFPAWEIVVSTHPRGRSNWLAADAVERARRFGLPVAHVVSRFGLEGDGEATGAHPQAAA